MSVAGNLSRDRFDFGIHHYNIIIVEKSSIKDFPNFDTEDFGCNFDCTALRTL